VLKEALVAASGMSNTQVHEKIVWRIASMLSSSQEAMSGPQAQQNCSWINMTKTELE
jgi:hypothetical protein